MKSLNDLEKDFPQIIISIKLSDLLESNRQLIKETKQQLEQQISEVNTETYHSISEVARILNVSKTTLWRWDKQKYLIPIEIGGKKKYKMSDIKTLLLGKKADL